MYTCTSKGANVSVNEPEEALTEREPSSEISCRLPSAGTLMVAVALTRLPLTAITYRAPLCSFAPTLTGPLPASAPGRFGSSNAGTSV